MIRLLLAAAVGLFVLSLPLSKTDTGATLRRAAGICLALALLPSILCGLFVPPHSTGGSAVHTSIGSGIVGVLALVGAVVILSLVAYAVLAVRKRLGGKPKQKDPWEALLSRGGGKRRVDQRDDDEFFGGLR